MTELKKGMIVKDNNGNTRLVLAMFEHVFCLSFINNYKSADEWYTIDDLKRCGYTWDEPTWEPKENDDYWFFDSLEGICKSWWSNNEDDNALRNFLGIYQTEEKAEEALVEIRRKLGK